jgi:uncharacterized membrane protein YkgB
MEKLEFTKKMRILAISIGIVYLWFGMLKFFPGVSPAENLAIDTIHDLTFGLLSPKVSIILLAIWEITIGLLFIFAPLKRIVIIFTLVHMVLTFTPFLVFPDLSFNTYPFSLTLIGQYIMKNIIIISALIVIYPSKSNSNISKKIAA